MNHLSSYYFSLFFSALDAPLTALNTFTRIAKTISQHLVLDLYVLHI